MGSGDAAHEKNEHVPKICRLCYVNFSTKQGPGCLHYFCEDCYQKQQENQEDNLETVFHCQACEKVGQSKQTTKIAWQNTSDEIDKSKRETKRKGVKQVNIFKVPKSANIVKPDALVVDETGDFIILDSGAGQVLLLDNQGKFIRSFKYLLNYEFKGGLAVTSEGIILVTLKSEKYSCIAFYQKNGRFRFSAFLPTTAVISSITVNSKEDIVALDTVNKTVCFINKEKRVHKTKQLVSDGENSGAHCPTSMTLNSHDDIFIVDNINKNVRIYDSHCAFMRQYETVGVQIPFIFRMHCATNDHMIAVTGDCKTVSMVHGGGKSIDSLVKYDSDDKCQWTVKDIAAYPQPSEQIAVLLSDCQKNTEIRTYSYSWPKPAKRHNGDSGDSSTSCCCTIL